MVQLNLFEAERPIPPPTPSNPAFVRKHLVRLLNIAREARWMPWPKPDAESWEVRFPRLAALLPPEEGEPMARAFAAELARLRGDAKEQSSPDAGGRAA